MPTYEYECKTCGHVFEAFQSMSDEPISVCPECGREVRRRIYGGTGIIFRGSGFYITDKPQGSGQAATRGRPMQDTYHEAGDGASSGGEKPAESGKAAGGTAGGAAGEKSGTGGAAGGTSGTESAKSGAKEPAKA